MRDKSVVITGATRGFGYAMGKLFPAEGARVMICGRSHESVRTAMESLRTDLAERAIHHFGRIDVWINDAAADALRTNESLGSLVHQKRRRRARRERCRHLRAQSRHDAHGHAHQRRDHLGGRAKRPKRFLNYGKPLSDLVSPDDPIELKEDRGTRVKITR